MINQALPNSQARPHCRARTLTAAALVVGILCVLLSGCGGGGDETATVTASGRVVIDASGWEGFKTLAQRAAAGEQVSRAEFEGLATTDAFTAWSASFTDGPSPQPIRVANWLERTFAAELGVESSRKLNPDLRSYTESYRWSWENRATVDEHLAQLRATGAATLDAQLAAWIPATRLPDTVMVHVLPMKPELRYNDGHLFVDAGVLAAGTVKQLVGQLSGLAYRNLGARSGPDPMTLQGDESVAQLFRVQSGESVASWLEDLPHTAFARNHPDLAKVQPVPENYWKYAGRAITLLDGELADYLGAAEGTETDTSVMIRSFVASGGISQGSYCMAATIIAVLGEDRLRAASPSIPAFVAAYQEATRENVEPLPQLQEVPGAYHLTMPPFSPEVWAGLEQLLRRQFPDDG